MSDKTMEWISAYIDGQLPEAEALRVEAWLRQDPHARQAYEEMKAWTSEIRASQPEGIVVPEDFRARILHKIKAEGIVPDPPPAVRGGLGKLMRSPYVVSGVVITGLLAGLAYLDRSGMKSVSAPGSSGPGALRQEEVSPRETPAKRTEASDLRRAASPLRVSAPELMAEGHSYIQGRGGRREKKSLAKAQTRTTVLENSAAWSAAGLRQRLPEADAERLLEAARLNRINPGLLVAAHRTLAAEDFHKTGRRIRRSLEATAGQPDEERLKKLLLALGGDLRLLPDWKASLKERKRQE